MVPIGALATLKQDSGPPLISLYNLYPSAAIVGSPAEGFSSGEAIDLMDQIAGQTLPPGTGYEWTAMSYQENIVGNQLLYVFRWPSCWSISAWPASTKDWIAPLAVILAVPLALIGPGDRAGAASASPTTSTPRSA